MSEHLICVTNRRLCPDDFPERIRKIAACRPDAILLREKDLSPEEYRALAEKVWAICRSYDVPCIFHTFSAIALELGNDKLHLPLPLLRTLPETVRKQFSVLGTSCHSLEDALEARDLGCTYLIAGHIYDTDCKKGLPGRGPEFLKQVCNAVSLPVYAIGGITKERLPEIARAGAYGGCIMSGFMQCRDVSAYFSS